MDSTLGRRAPDVVPGVQCYGDALVHGIPRGYSGLKWLGHTCCENVVRELGTASKSG